MTPAGFESGYQSGEVFSQLSAWAKRDGRGVAVELSTGFRLPNGATRAADAAWISKSRLKNVPREAKKKFLPLCPDFVVEVKSPSDQLSALKTKMQEYIENGAQLGWLIDPEERRIFVYRPNGPEECLENPQTVAGNPVLPGFILDLKEIWAPDI